MLPSLMIAGAVAIAILVFTLVRLFAFDRIERLIDGRRQSSRIVSRAEFIDAGRHVTVSLALTDKALYYENAEMQASLDLNWIEEVTYENESVMRLRCFNRIFEFIIPPVAAARWQSMLAAQSA